MKISLSSRGIRLVFILSTLLSITESASAFSETAFQASFQKFTTMSGDQAIEQSAEEFAQLLASEPTNPLLMAYAGASTAKLATTTLFPWKKMSYAEDGLAKLDKALQLATRADTNSATHTVAMHGTVPVTLEVKFVAATTFLAVPSFMHRASQGQQLLNDILQQSQFPTTAISFRGAVWLRAARLAIDQQHLERAKDYLTSVIQMNAPQAPVAAQMLKGLPS